MITIMFTIKLNVSFIIKSAFITKIMNHKIFIDSAFLIIYFIIIAE